MFVSSKYQTCANRKQHKVLKVTTLLSFKVGWDLGQPSLIATFGGFFFSFVVLPLSYVATASATWRCLNKCLIRKFKDVMQSLK